MLSQHSSLINMPRHPLLCGQYYLWTMSRSLVYCLISLLIWRKVSSLIATPPSVYCNHYRSSSCISNFSHKLSSRNRRRLISQRRRYTLLQSAAHDRISNSHVIIDSAESATNHTNNRIEEVSTTHTHQSSDNTQTSNNIINKQLQLTDLPKHVAFICDGNSRWAKSNSLHESLGHVAGADRVVSLIKTLQCLRIDTDNADNADAHDESTSLQSIIDMKEDIQSSTNQQQQQPNQTRIEYCTLFAFSTENWSRPQLEINALFKLITQTAIKYQTHSSIVNGMIQITLLGNIHDDRIPDDMRSALLELVKISTDACDNERRRRRLLEEDDDEDRDDDILTICLAINYGGRSDIVQAATKLAQSIASGEVTLDNNEDTTQQQLVNESLISSRLSTSKIPDPDLIIRTGGEYRLSNFLLWNVAYTELYFSDLLWPDFNYDELMMALRWYGLRNRRFGGR